MTERYGTADGFRAYLAERNITATNSTDDALVNAALLVATEWLDSRYRAVFPGLKTSGRLQLRQWPRRGASDIYGYYIDYLTVPVQIENATYEAARIELDVPGQLTVNFTRPEFTEAVISGAMSVKYNTTLTVRDVQLQVQAVDQVLYEIIRPEWGGSSISGTLTR